MKDKRDVLIEYVNYLYEFPDSPRRASADSILNELHQAGWAVCPRGPLVNTDQTVLVQTTGGLVSVALREDSDDVWGPPVHVELA